MSHVMTGRRFILTTAVTLVLVALCSIGQDGCNVQPRVGTTTCLGCHDGRSAPDQREFLESGHRRIACEECHGPGYAHVRNGGRDGLFIENPGRRPFSRSYQLCEDCHEQEVETYLQTAHGTAPGARCTDCHNVHTRSGLVVDKTLPALFDNETATQLCRGCHRTQVEGFLLSGHVERGGAACGNCHDMHVPQALTSSTIDNAICLQCHSSFFLGFDSEEAIDFHTGPFHPVDPEGSGSSRCTSCHLPPLNQLDQPDGSHDHTLFTVPPESSNEAAAAGVTPVPPNSCAGILGCHDAFAPGSGTPYNVNSEADNDFLQPLYESIGNIP